MCIQYKSTRLGASIDIDLKRNSKKKYLKETKSLPATRLAADSPSQQPKNTKVLSKEALDSLLSKERNKLSLDDDYSDSLTSGDYGDYEQKSNNFFIFSFICVLTKKT